jgi:hypothetical protein
VRAYACVTSKVKDFKNWTATIGILTLSVGGLVTVAATFPAFATTNSTDGSKDEQNSNGVSAHSSSDKENRFMDEIKTCFSNAKSNDEFSEETEKCIHDVLDKYFIYSSDSAERDESEDGNGNDTSGNE